MLRSLKSVCLVTLSLWAFAGVAVAKKEAPKPPPTDAQLGFEDITRSELLARIKRVGLLPVKLPPAFGKRDDVRQALGDSLGKYLRLAGFEVVGPEGYQSIYDRMNREAGGVFDAHTGAYKAELGARIGTEARAEFMRSQHLDGCIVTVVMTRTAHYQGLIASWDGVQDRADGKAPSHSLFDLYEGSDFQGKLPGLSLVMQISDPQDHPLYLRVGGIQLAAYFENEHFVELQPKLLLQDSARLERAVKVATVPLRYTALQISAGEKNPEINPEVMNLHKLPAPPEAAPRGYKSPLQVPREQILAGIHRVAVSPVYIGDLKVPNDAPKRWVDLVRAELAPLKWDLVETPQLGKLMYARMLQANLFDPLTGVPDEASAAAARMAVLEQLGAGAKLDGVLWIELERVSARYEDSSVAWDGVMQDAVTLGAPAQRAYAGWRDPGTSSTGSIPAASLKFVLTDANESVLYRGRGGLQLLSRLKITPATSFQAGRADLTPLGTDELFRESERDATAVHVGLRDLVLTPEALNRELTPVTAAAR